jgi:hypothetical protein
MIAPPVCIVAATNAHPPAAHTRTARPLLMSQIARSGALVLADAGDRKIGAAPEGQFWNVATREPTGPSLTLGQQAGTGGALASHSAPTAASSPPALAPPSRRPLLPAAP